jgi:signal transduction histidine kinase
MDDSIRSEFSQGGLASQVIMSLTQGLAIVGLDGKFIYWNQNAERFFDMGTSEVPRNQWSNNSGFFEVDGITKVAYEDLPLRRSLKGEVVSNRECLIKNERNPKGIFIRFNAAPLKDSSGAIVGAFAISTDFTHERTLGQQLIQAQKMESIGQLAGGIAHDFNNKLAAMTLALSELSKRCSCCNEEPSELSILKKLVEQSALLTKQILAFSRRQMLSPIIFDLNELVGEELQFLVRLMGSEVEVISRLNASESKICVDRSQLDQVIFNLAINARDAMPDGGTLIIETETLLFKDGDDNLGFEMSPGLYCVLTMSDTGVGIEKHNLDRIMEPFFTTKPEGTGLGLSTVVGIVRQSGGHIRVYSELGKGASFRIYFPVSKSKPEVATLESGTGSRSEKYKPLKILVVDDETALLGLTTKVLRSLGHEVAAFESAKAAAEYAEKQDKIDLLLTDTVMPGLSSRQLEKQLLKKFPELKTIYMSGYSHEVITRKGILEPGIHFLQKPFPVQNLENLIASLFYV